MLLYPAAYRPFGSAIVNSACAVPELAMGNDAACVRACGVRISTAHDADEQARNLVGWHQTYDQLTAGPFVGTRAELPPGQMQGVWEATGHTLRATYGVRPGAYVF